MADEDEDEGKQDGWVDCYFGYGEGFEGCHCGFREGLGCWYGIRRALKGCINSLSLCFGAAAVISRSQIASNMVQLNNVGYGQ